MFTSLDGINPDKRASDARDELHKAQLAYADAEDRLIKARRDYENASREWRTFHFPSQDNARI